MCCPKGWKRFQESCYYLSDDKMGWAESKQNCTGMDSHLVVINSEAEQVVLNGYSPLLANTSSVDIFTDISGKNKHQRAPAEDRSCSWQNPWVFLVSVLAIKTVFLTICIVVFLHGSDGQYKTLLQNATEWCCIHSISADKIQLTNLDERASSFCKGWFNPTPLSVLVHCMFTQASRFWKLGEPNLLFAEKCAAICTKGNTDSSTYSNWNNVLCFTSCYKICELTVKFVCGRKLHFG
ncbi:Clec4c [Columba guinea]|nr:Clec4c [Columba guinea]